MNQLFRNNSIENATKAITDIEKRLILISESKPYKRMVFFQRLKNEFLKGTRQDKREYCYYLKNALKKHYTYPAKPWFWYDPLCKMKIEINESPLPLRQNNMKQVFIFAGPPLSNNGGGQRFAMIAKEMAQLGCQVHYLYYSAPHTLELIPTHYDNIWQGLIFYHTPSEVFANSSENDLCIFEAPIPYFKKYLDYANNHSMFTIYEQVDNWDSILGKNFYNREIEEYFINNVKAVTATAKELINYVNSISKSDNIIYSPNAVNIKLFNNKHDYSRPHDIPEWNGKVILYYGMLWDSWIDMELIIQTATLCKDCLFVLIGQENISRQNEIKAENILFLGLKKQEELPKYLSFSDIAIIPFKVDNIGKYVSPLKIYEYLAMGVPVLSTPLPDINDYPNVTMLESSSDWADYIHGNISFTNCDEFINSNSWTYRCRELLSLVK